MKDEARPPKLGRLLVRLFAPHWRGLLLTGAIALAAALLTMLIGTFAKLVVRLFEDEEPVTGLLVTWALVAVLSVAFVWLATTAAYRVGLSVVRPFAEHAFGHLLRQSLEAHGRREAGASKALMSRLVDQLGSRFTSGLAQLISSLSLAAGSLLGIATIDWRWALAAMPIGWLGFRITTAVTIRHKRMLLEQIEHERELASIAEETQWPANFRLIRRTALEHHFEGRFVEAHGKMHGVLERRRFSYSLVSRSLDLVPMLAPPLAWLVGDATGADMGTIVSIAVLLPQMLHKVLMLTYPYFDLIEIAPTVEEALALCEPGCPGHFDDERDPEPEAAAAPTAGGDAALVLDGVCVARGDKLVLDGVNLVVRPGDRVALVGRNGAGKSTLLETIAQLLKLESGSITLGGVPIHEISRLVRRGRIAIVEPLPTLFTGTVRYNLTLLWPDAPEDAIRWACAAAGVDFDLDDAAADLSTGQQMRVVIARALLLRPGIMMFDESFAHLDPGTLREILATIDRSLPNSAVVVVSHQRDAELMDVLHVLAAGRIAQSGTFDELKAAADGPFQEYMEATD